MALSKDISKKDVKTASSLMRKTLSELIVPIFCVGSALLLVLFVIRPGIERIREGREEKEEREAMLAQLEAKNRVLSKYAAQINQLDSELELMRNAVPQEEKIPELMTQLQDMANEATVSTSALQYGGSKEGKEEETKTVRLQMTVEGEYGQVEELFELFEDASRIVLLDQFGLKTQKEASMSVNMGLSSFYFEAPNKAAIDEPIEREFSSPAFRSIIDRIERLNYYEVRVEQGDVGKENPFSE